MSLGKSYSFGHKAGHAKPISRAESFCYVLTISGLHHGFHEIWVHSCGRLLRRLLSPRLLCWWLRSGWRLQRRLSEGHLLRRRWLCRHGRWRRNCPWEESRCQYAKNDQRKAADRSTFNSAYAHPAMLVRRACSGTCCVRRAMLLYIRGTY